MFRKAAIVFAGLLVVGLPGASAQDRTLEPSYGTLKLQGNFEPVVLDLLAGGEVNAFDEVGGDCVGHIANAPDLLVNFTASGDTPLVFSVSSLEDTTLIIEGPDGTLFCGDDANGTIDPVVVINNPASGAYAVWVGTYFEGRYEDATLTIANGQSAPAALNWDLAPEFGEAELAGGFLPDPFWVDVTAGGTVDMSSVGALCWGYTGAEPDFRVFFQPEGDAPLTFYVMSEADTTIAIADPDGNWFCNDDTNGLNPQITFDTPVNGQYDVWIGTFDSGPEQAATLFITELGGPVEPDLDTDTDTTGDPEAMNPVDVTLPALFGEIALESGFLPDPHTVEVTAGGGFFAFDLDNSCVGYLSEAPSYRLTYTPGIFPLYIWAEVAADGTLVVLDPDGNWICDDDGAARPLDPAIAIESPVAGDYLIWVGTYGENESEATLFISEVTDGRDEGTETMPDNEAVEAVEEDDASEAVEEDDASPAALPDAPVFME